MAANLAVVYCARGVAHQARDMIEPAIADDDASQDCSRGRHQASVSRLWNLGWRPVR